jgi:hypothetical protein
MTHQILVTIDGLLFKISQREQALSILASSHEAISSSGVIRAARNTRSDLITAQDNLKRIENLISAKFVCVDSPEEVRWEFWNPDETQDLKLATEGEGK